ncbi:putative 1-alkyl-2-acetylglycerophosphocholine esterase [Lachnellula suecica]|uniref:1-alkyl-2-acetylglycerophosphocholine esterase n=1 Tax=Lachnellula suecica TaxID=602035 RepID=A0A8T9CB50_9HELO|nr:putative 1-alkyl-2-acetylglycerophosphocholine esterase [Lachnellula suecica]
MSWETQSYIRCASLCSRACECKELAILGLVLLFSSYVATHNILLPKLLGPHSVGTVSFELINTPYSPPRDLMLYAHYPTTKACSCEYPLARDFSPTFGKWLDAFDNFTHSDRIVTRVHESAPISSSKFPILLFGPGYGEPVQLSGRHTMSNLASQGYVVIGVNHPNDSEIIEYPDGRVVYYQENENITDFDQLIPSVEARVSDMNFLASQLRNTSVTDNIPGLKDGFDFESIGTLGFSLGGASAATAMIDNPIYACGANMDGAFIENVTEIGLDKPFFMMNSLTHTWPTDDTWPTFYHNLRGFKKDIQVSGTRHKAYSDWLILKNLLVKNDTDPANANLLFGTGLIEISNAYLTSFFDMCLKNGTGELLQGPSEAFPEVAFLS